MSQECFFSWKRTSHAHAHTHMPKNKQSRNLVSSIHQLTDRHTFRAEVHDLHRDECSVSCKYTSLYTAFLLRRILQEGLLHVCSTLDAHRWAVPVPHNAAMRQGHVELLAAKLLLLHFLRPRQNAHTHRIGCLKYPRRCLKHNKECMLINLWDKCRNHTKTLLCLPPSCPC